MKNRTTDPETIGLEAWLEDTRVVLPLRAVSVRADLTAGFADVAGGLGWMRRQQSRSR
ncbi:MAG: hypothetical protein O3A75_06795 [Verrucomicrobia bacterium]|nr:hypothetical protein [Verrucomicrobiota bacterium]